MCQGVGSVNLIAAPDALRGPVRRVSIPTSGSYGKPARTEMWTYGTTILREPSTARTQPACAIAAASRSRDGT
ncbi:hypothetical protein GCM10009760_06420 [Kitasatospora kazusensis]|uniref:Uncharacterized protein n=1 Tax=Kitasatospora kazusensis TaxID=407974 RepID=A0ABN2YTH1_9ACTN